MQVNVHVSPPVSVTEGKKEPVAWWIILLSVLGALLLIVAFVLVLWKVRIFTFTFDVEVEAFRSIRKYFHSMHIHSTVYEHSYCDCKVHKND